MKRIRDLVVFALCIILALAPAVSANSLPGEWVGTTVTGVSFDGDQCPIEVLQEHLTFDIPHFPGRYEDYELNTDSVSNEASVTAEYVFHNPTDADITATLLFPLGDQPQYGPGNTVDVTEYGVWIDGERIEMELRHSFRDGIPFSSDRDTAALRDTLAVHEFYSPELPVTKYTYRLTGAEPLGPNYDTAKLYFYSDPSRTKVIMAPARSMTHREDHTFVGTALNEDLTAVVYEIGQRPEKPHEWTTQAGQMELVSTETMSFQHFVLSGRPADSQISELDWYNMIVDRMTVSEWDGGFLFEGVFGGSYDHIMPWYRYELTVPAGGSVVNTVTAPLYPTIHEGWSPAIYTYRYLLSPAKGWAGFGPLDIHIKTPFSMTQCNLEGFEKTAKGYSLRLDGLPEKELEFVLSSVKNPKQPGSGIGRRLVLRVVLLAAVLTVIFVSKKRKK